MTAILPSGVARRPELVLAGRMLLRVGMFGDEDQIYRVIRERLGGVDAYSIKSGQVRTISHGELATDCDLVARGMEGLVYDRVIGPERSIGFVRDEMRRTDARPRPSTPGPGRRMSG